jgi:hypothetical protein
LIYKTLFSIVRREWESCQYSEKVSFVTNRKRRRKNRDRENSARQGGTGRRGFAQRRIKAEKNEKSKERRRV